MSQTCQRAPHRVRRLRHLGREVVDRDPLGRRLDETPAATRTVIRGPHGIRHRPAEAGHGEVGHRGALAPLVDLLRKQPT